MSTKRKASPGVALFWMLEVSFEHKAAAESLHLACCSGKMISSYAEWSIDSHLLQTLYMIWQWQVSSNVYISRVVLRGSEATCVLYDAFSDTVNSQCFLEVSNMLYLKNSKAPGYQMHQLCSRKSFSLYTCWNPSSPTFQTFPATRSLPA